MFTTKKIFHFWLTTVSKANSLQKLDRYSTWKYQFFWINPNFVRIFERERDSTIFLKSFWTKYFQNQHKLFTINWRWKNFFGSKFMYFIFLIFVCYKLRWNIDMLSTCLPLFSINCCYFMPNFCSKCASLLLDKALGLKIILKKTQVKFFSFWFFKFFDLFIIWKKSETNLSHVIIYICVVSYHAFGAFGCFDIDLRSYYFIEIEIISILSVDQKFKKNW